MSFTGPVGRDFDDLKCSDHRGFSLAMTCFTAVAGTSLWMWDYTIDPAASWETIWIRALIIPNALVYIYALYMGMNARWTSAAAAVMILGWEVGFIFALSLLKDGVIYGQAGFVFFFIMPLLVTRGLPFAFNVVLVLLTSLVPFFFYLAGSLPGFPVLLYFQLVAPMSFMVLPAMYAIDQGYRTNLQYRRSLEMAAFTDPLTGSANRRKLDETIDAFIRAGRDVDELFSVLVVDIDDFKTINDTYGHATGDLVIKAVAECCRAHLRPSDMLSRTGGEEFLVTLPKTTSVLACAIAERLRKVVADQNVRSDAGPVVTCTVSIGVASARLDRMPFTGLARRADEALYRAKRNGKNQACTFEPAAF